MDNSQGCHCVASTKITKPSVRCTGYFLCDVLPRNDRELQSSIVRAKHLRPEAWRGGTWLMQTLHEKACRVLALHKASDETFTFGNAILLLLCTS